MCELMITTAVGTLVKLTPLELRALWDMAVARNDAKTIGTNKMYGGVSDEALHYIGLKGEYAVSKLLGIDINTEIYDKGDVGHDLEYLGHTIEVKVSQRDLKFFQDRPPVADIVALVVPQIVSLANVTAKRDYLIKHPLLGWQHQFIVGWITKERLMELCYQRDFGYGVRDVLDRESLIPPMELLLLEDRSG